MTGDSEHFVGCDPGFSGAFAVLNRAGTLIRVWDMPVQGQEKHREVSRTGLAEIFDSLVWFPDTTMGIEFPTTRPGEPPEPAAKFRHGIGLIEGFAYCRSVASTRIPPQLWTGRLGLAGKDKEGWKEQRAQMILTAYPQAQTLLYGPRGGFLDGRADAILIAHAMITGVLIGKFSGMVNGLKRLKGRI